MRSQDGDGQLGLDELRQALSAVGDLDGLGTAEQAWTGAEVDALFAALDTEGLGRYGPRAPESL